MIGWVICTVLSLTAVAVVAAIRFSPHGDYPDHDEPLIEWDDNERDAP